MSTLEERFEQGVAMRTLMAAGDPSHFTLPAIDELAPDLRRIVDEALFGSIWTRPGLSQQHRCICTISALTALGQLPLLKRHIERGLNVGLTPDQIVEILIQLTFYVGVPAVGIGLEVAKEVFAERGIQFTPTLVYDAQQDVSELYHTGVQVHQEHIGEITVPETSSDPDSEEMQLERLINQYHWGAIYTRPHLDAKSRAMCALSVMTVKGPYDRQIRRRIEGAFRVGMTAAEVMEIFIHLTLYGGYFHTRTAMQVARSVLTERRLAVERSA
jgi:4-carboxymuconolactone decarboxylase